MSKAKKSKVIETAEAILRTEDGKSFVQIMAEKAVDRAIAEGKIKPEQRAFMIAAVCSMGT